MAKSATDTAGRKAGPLSGIQWTLSTANTVAVIGVLAIALLLLLRRGFRPINLG